MLRVRVNLNNPGHYFACGGLFELAVRTCGAEEARFVQDDAGQWFFEIQLGANGPNDGCGLLRSCAEVSLSTLSPEEEQRLQDIKRRLRDESLSADEKARYEEEKKRIEKKAREGTLWLGKPFCLELDWWLDDASPKTWAGQQGVAQIAQACARGMRAITSVKDCFDYAAVLTSSGRSKVEPFYFDARRFAGALDAGFSLDAIGARTSAYPAVEFLALVGLQRFRPKPLDRFMYGYSVWTKWLPLEVGGAAAAGLLPGTRQHRFRLRFRDDQRRYKAFGFAQLIEEAD